MICVSVVETELMTCSGSGENITQSCGCEQLKSSLMPLGLFGIQHPRKKILIAVKLLKSRNTVNNFKKKKRQNNILSSLMIWVADPFLHPKLKNESLGENGCNT